MSNELRTVVGSYERGHIAQDEQIAQDFEDIQRLEDLAAIGAAIDAATLALGHAIDTVPRDGRPISGCDWWTPGKLDNRMNGRSNAPINARPAHRIRINHPSATRYLWVMLKGS